MFQRIQPTWCCWWWNKPSVFIMALAPFACRADPGLQRGGLSDTEGLRFVLWVNPPNLWKTWLRAVQLQ